MNVRTYWARIYMSGPIKVAKQALREEALRDPVCFTIEPTTFVYEGGEESGFVVGLINYPRFPSQPHLIRGRALAVARHLLAATFQRSALVMTPETTTWLRIEDAEAS